MNNSIRHMYIRDSRRNPIGCITLKIDRKNNRVEYGVSMRNPVDALDKKGKSVRFDRVLAQKLACENLLTNPKQAYLSSEANMHDATAAIMKDMVARKVSPSGALKFAKHWLNSNTPLRMMQANTPAMDNYTNDSYTNWKQYYLQDPRTRPSKNHTNR